MPQAPPAICSAAICGYQSLAVRSMGHSRLRQIALHPGSIVVEGRALQHDGGQGKVLPQHIPALLPDLGERKGCHPTGDSLEGPVDPKLPERLQRERRVRAEEALPLGRHLVSHRSFCHCVPP
jgi:hypothetical protein